MALLLQYVDPDQVLRLHKHGQCLHSPLLANWVADIASQCNLSLYTFLENNVRSTVPPAYMQRWCRIACLELSRLSIVGHKPSRL